MIYRQEHPKPQFERENWVNLNGEWQFEYDHATSGLEKDYSNPEKTFSMKINVPFCPESKLSGIENRDFMRGVWYKRDFAITEEQLQSRIFLHFGAVDYEAHVFVNGKLCGVHRGGYISFAYDITDLVTPGTNVLTVYAYDDVRDDMEPCGKQSMLYPSEGCSYTRTTGIWQTVWLEMVPRTHIVRTEYLTDIASGTLTIRAELEGSAVLKAEAFYEGRPVGDARLSCQGGAAALQIRLTESHLWEVGQGRLYDLVLTYGEDKVKSYFGMRSVELDGYKFRINGKSVFQRLVLDQSFFPDGVYTAPSDAELAADIDRSQAMGFNGCRLHEKIPEERFLYHADRKGYLVWGEYPDWGLNRAVPQATYSLVPEWIEEVRRDMNHPAIIGWCPCNEIGDWNQGMLRLLYQTTKALDPTRPVIDASGGFHAATDIFDVHNYAQDPEQLRSAYARIGEGKVLDVPAYPMGKPIYVSEYGGIGWSENMTGWSYGNAPKSREEYLERLKGLTDALMDNPYLFGFCYTQLTDVEQEQNGVYYYDRRPKVDPAIVHKIMSRKAAIED